MREKNENSSRKCRLHKMNTKTKARIYVEKTGMVHRYRRGKNYPWSGSRCVPVNDAVPFKKMHRGLSSPQCLDTASDE